MTKRELVAALADECMVPKKTAESMVNTMVSIIEDKVVSGEKVQIVGFGTFEARERAARNGVNPRTQKAIKIPATVVPVFKAGKSFRESVAEKKHGKK